MINYFKHVIVALLVTVSYHAQAELIVIGNLNVKADTLTQKEIKRLYLGKRNSLNDGTQVELADQAEGDSTRDDFYNTLVGKNPIQLRAYWARRVFSGKGMPPVVVGDDDEVIKWVVKTKGGIGYVDTLDSSSTVKVLFRSK